MQKGIQVDGLNKAIRQLNKLEPSVTEEIKALNKTLAGQVASTAANKAPVRTGKLRNSVRAGASKRSGTVKAGKKAVPYAGPIHFGWSRRNIAPNPFMWDALDARRSEIEREWLKQIEELTKDIR